MNSILIDNRIDDIKFDYSFALKKILEKLDKKNWEVSLVIVDEDDMKNLNLEYMGKNSPTDVLSFPQGDSSFIKDSGCLFYAGDIVLCPAQVEHNCNNFNVEYEEESYRLLIHGILHLDGYTHKGYDKNQEMLILQEKILRELI